MAGDGCEFCHLPHPNKAKQMDKREREALRQMPVETAELRLLPVIREKVLSGSRCVLPSPC